MTKAARLFRLMWLSRPLMQRVEEMVRDGLEGTGLTVRMRAVLEILDAKGPLSVPDIGRELQIQRQYVQVMVNEVIAEGLSEKSPNPRHRSSPLVALTARGQRVIRDVLDMEQSKAERLSGHFSDEEIEISLCVVERLCSVIGQGGDGALSGQDHPPDKESET